MEVLVKPLGRVIDVPAGTKLLDALLQHGLPISYSCMAGRCGTCRCTVISGDVSGPAAAEGRPAQQQGTTVLACQAQVNGDCVIEVPEPDEVVVHPARIIQTEVTAFDALTHDVRRLRLKPRKPLDYSPGQYAHLQFAPDAIRPYSMAGLPADPELEFHIRIVPDGRVTPRLAETLKVGDKVRVSGPLGASYLRRKHDGPMLCVAGGTGLAPMLSVVRGALAAGMSNPIDLIFGARTEADLYGVDELQALASQHPSFRYHLALSFGADGKRYHAGYVTDVLTALYPNLRDWRIYMAGPPAMVDAVELLSVRRGALPKHIYADAFYPAGI
ncbi:MAG TPA: 2Fe-2S iron-sulfur cluster-binding protein [Gammaproteobacteria bacterium]|nr:2Fe-2S iron-sulfur cluster-binding protein [Gammaproteobacteria bacterium]